MRRLPPHLAPAGYSPRRYLPLSPAPVLGMGERLTDLREMQALFAHGENGGYWPADPAYAYEDSAGTTAASVNGVVGLRYDVSKGLALGPNLWIPASVNLAAGWTRNGDIFTCDGTSGNIWIVDVLTTGRFYRFTVDLVGVVNVFLGSSSYVSDATGDNYFWQAINAGSPNVTIQNATTGIKTVTNVSVNEVYGNHAIQTTTGNKPYLRLTPTTNKYWYDSNTATGAMNVTFASALGSACTIATVTPEGVSILESQTVGATYNICPPYGYNSDVLIIDRALTPAEKALVTRVMQRSVPALGSELVVNGGFDDGATGWYVDPIWSISNGIASSPGGSIGYLNQGNCFSGVGVGSFIYFKADVTVSSPYFYYLGGTIGAGSPLNASQNIRVVAYRISIDNNILYIKADSTFVGSVDNISAKVIL